ncbi:hypothetical protein [Streptomyces sp. NPDC004533]|uniref:hypothetical protein n=1 Tax=Streptomyces sp. NPDC004533 TaxID=3154278 RepID=UPI00339ECD7E
MLRIDGTFVARKVCGFGVYDDLPGSDRGNWGIGHGLWSADEHGADTGGVWFFGKASSNELDEGGNKDSPVLWQNVGDPDRSVFCELHKSAVGPSPRYSR